MLIVQIARHSAQWLWERFPLFSDNIVDINLTVQFWEQLFISACANLICSKFSYQNKTQSTSIWYLFMESRYKAYYWFIFPSWLMFLETWTWLMFPNFIAHMRLKWSVMLPMQETIVHYFNLSSFYVITVQYHLNSELSEVNIRKNSIKMKQKIYVLFEIKWLFQAILVFCKCLNLNIILR